MEDEFLFPDEMFSMKIGHSYVVPICNVGNEIFMTTREVLSGDIQRESIYSTIYPFHPQIEVTDRGYIVTTDWETLMEGEKKHITMDVELSEYGSFYKDKMMLIPKDSFSTQMGILIEKIG
ncbi:MAG: hypothetical protein GX275_13735 [Clostridiales bacterium]|nr:hypothetical protein [Clostridiales bacterium]